MSWQRQQFIQEFNVILKRAHHATVILVFISFVLCFSLIAALPFLTKKYLNKEFPKPVIVLFSIAFSLFIYFLLSRIFIFTPMI